VESCQERPDRPGDIEFRRHVYKGNVILVRGLDCLDGTPLLDLKPDRTLFTPIAPPQKGDCQVGDP
jgi:tRNA (Thr-GGU) A37 N-methylase